MEPRISVVTLGVTDLDRACTFYEAMGWPAPRRPDAEVAFFQANGLVLALWTGVEGRGAPGLELAYNVRAAEEVAPVLDAAAAAGGSVVRPAALAEWGGTSGAFADPEGYVWEVAHNPEWPIGEDGSVTM
jgi:catechol 2,3-dioxygenase-like lactoylglutathione lyase family enzyme